MNLTIYITLTLGIIGLFSRVLTDKESRLYTLLTLGSPILIGSGTLLMMFDNIYRGLFVLALLIVLAIISNGLESDSRYIRKIYKEVGELRRQNPDKNDKEIMKDLFDLRFPKIGMAVREEILNESEDFEDMLLRTIEFNSSGKISKTLTINDLEREDDAF